VGASAPADVKRRWSGKAVRAEPTVLQMLQRPAPAQPVDSGSPDISGAIKRGRSEHDSPRVDASAAKRLSFDCARSPQANAAECCAASEPPPRVYSSVCEAPAADPEPAATADEVQTRPPHAAGESGPLTSGGDAAADAAAEADPGGEFGMSDSAISEQRHIWNVIQMQRHEMGSKPKRDNGAREGSKTKRSSGGARAAPGALKQQSIASLFKR